MRFAIIGLLGAGFALAVLTIRRRVVRAVATDVGGQYRRTRSDPAGREGERAEQRDLAATSWTGGLERCNGIRPSSRAEGTLPNPVVAPTVRARVRHDERVKGSVCKAVIALERYVADHYDRAADGESRQRSLEKRGVDCRPPRQLVVLRPGRQRVRLPGHRRTGGLTDGWDY
jgi:hypothetical protein